MILANGFRACFIRPLMYLEGPPALNLDEMRAHISISTWEWGTLLGKEALEKGATAIVSSFTRKHPNASMTKAKITGQYANSMLAKAIAQKVGVKEVILLDTEGYVEECSGENIFLVWDGKIYTPPKGAILEGITHDSVFTIAHDLGYQVIEEAISQDQLYIADEIFVCGMAAEVTPVSEIDCRKIGKGKRGPVMKEIQEAFFEKTRGRGKNLEKWLDWSRGALPWKSLILALQSVRKLPNISPKSAQWLEAVGIRTEEDLEELSAVKFVPRGVWRVEGVSVNH